ncbi:sialic acid-binding Ig-like lectin 14 [Notamacropus eugenii]|uniref:sialic acid-binding Ig-like lectin 14 n=1 Tax=Notamacropus eugenii TaxID=9315 RepID=UPI003B6767BB
MFLSLTLHTRTSCFIFLFAFSLTEVNSGSRSVQGVTQHHSGAWLSPVSQMLLLLLPLLWEGSLCQRLEVPPSVTVQERMCAQVPCTFNTGGLRLYYKESIYGYWYREGSDISYHWPVATSDPKLRVEQQVQGRFHLVGDIRMKNCSLRITDAQFSDRGRYFFAVSGSYKHSYRNQLLYVHVTDFIQRPDISIPEMLELGNPVTLTCTFPWACGENRPLKFSWMGAALSSKPQISEVSSSSTVSFIPQHHHHGTNLTCHVTFLGSSLSSERTVQLNVSFFSAQKNSSWPLVLTLLRGALMGAGFLLTYGLTWLYYTRKPLRATPEAAQSSVMALGLKPG